MGGIFSSRKRPAPVEAESAASYPRPFDDVHDAEDIIPATAQPPLKRRRIEPHNDPITPLYAPPSVPAKESGRNRLTEPYQPRQNLQNGNKSVIEIPKTPRSCPKKRRYAVFLGYHGANYSGMQVNPGVVTIEGLLLEAFHKAGFVSEQNFSHPSKIGFMRAARTDKGVSAAVQVVSAKLEVAHDYLINPSTAANLINNHLPQDISVYGLLRVTPSFNARQDCRKRRYEYIFPLHLLGGNGDTVMTDGEKGQDSRVQKFSAILKQYEGSHCFANFTDGVKPEDDSARRFMFKVTCLPPFRPPFSDKYYVTVEVIGQSFLLHQIRRMVGLALIIYHGHAPPQAIPVALCGDSRFPTPTAPPDGLLLDSLYFDQYNRNHGPGIPKKISDEHFAERKLQFKANQIYRQIAEKECREGVLEAWVRNCETRISISKDEILKLHQMFVLTDAGKRQIRERYTASLYPVRNTFDEFLDCNAQDKFRQLAEKMRSRFKYRYGAAPAFLVRAPGRVILIGEHLDYNGLPVVSAALRQGTLIAGSFDDGKHVDVSHFEDSAYRPGRMDVNGKLEREEDKHSHDDAVLILDDDDDQRDSRWLRYVGFGVKTVAKSLNFKRTVSGGGRLLIGGDLPRAGGLASSSSLVCASVLAGARLSRRRLPRQDLAIAGAESERGCAKTCGGNLDHLTSMCAEKGHVLHTTFIPRVELKQLKWPSEAKLFAVNSGVTAEKGGDEAMRLNFNLRVAECHIGAAIAAHRLGVALAEAVFTPGQLLFNARKSALLRCENIERLAELVRSVIPLDEVISIEEAREVLKLSESNMSSRFLRGIDSSNAPSLKIGKRLAHVYDEARRVSKFEQVLNNEWDVDQKINALGQILNDGHESLQHLFETSVPQVDEVVRICRESGAVGTRMTGAGWGGFVISIVSECDAPRFVEALSSQVGEENLFEIEPWSGATVCTIHGSNSSEKS